jgi:hypothetical protein
MTTVLSKKRKTFKEMQLATECCPAMPVKNRFLAFLVMWHRCVA